MKTPSSSVALLTLAAFIRCNIAIAWLPVDTASGQPVPNPSAVPLYRDSGNSSEIYHIYFNPDNRELLWRIVSHDGGQDEIYYQTLPDYVKTVSASTFKDSRVYIAGMTTEEHWFISAWDQFGEMIWLQQGSKGSKEIPQKNLEIDRLAMSDNGKELYVRGSFLDNPLHFALDAADGEGAKYSLDRVGRKLLQSGEMPSLEPPDDLFPHPEEKARVVVIEWFLGVLGGVGAVLGFIGAGYGLYQFKKGLNEEKVARIEEGKAREAEDKARKEEEIEREIQKEKRLKDDWDKENARRQAESDFINVLKKQKMHKKLELYNPESFKAPFHFLVTEASSQSIPLPLLTPSQAKERVSEIKKEMKAKNIPDSIISSQFSLNHLLAKDMLELNLFEYIKVGDIKNAMDILTENPQLISVLDDDENTPLHYAVIGQHTTLVTFLINKGASLNTRNSDGYTPLILAAHLGNSVIFELVLGSQASIPDKELSAIFHIISQTPEERKSKHLVHELLGRGLNKQLIFKHIQKCGPVVPPKGLHNSQSLGGLTVLHEAVISGNIELVRLYINRGIVDIDEVDDNGNTALHYAVLHDTGEHDLVTFLLESNAEINAQNCYGDTPLHNAVYRKNKEMIRFLTKNKGINLDLENSNSLTPIFSACLCARDEGIINLLLPDSRLMSHDKLHLIHFIIRNRELSRSLKILLESEYINTAAIIELEDNLHNTPLYLAVQLAIEENFSFPARLLIKAGANYNRPHRKSGKTPYGLLLELDEKSRTQEVKRLIETIQQKEQ